jgi:tRNA-dihydrouridine synthase B
MSFWHNDICIRNLSFPRFIGGPLDNITDSPFRQLVRDFSKNELLYTEMRHVSSVAHDVGGQRSLKFEQWERPLNFQFSANRIQDIDRALDKVCEIGVDSVDLNVGCPARNVVNSGSGSALMADLPRLEILLKHFRMRLSIPFTVKIRAGFKSCNALEVAKLAEQCGVDALAIHPRLQTQMFEGRPDYMLAAAVKKALTIPVILSGNVVNWQTAKLAYEQTGVDGFLIGRGIWGRPWKLQEMREHSLGNTFELTQQEIMKYALKHFNSMLAYYGPPGLYAFRKHMPFYIRSVVGASTVRGRLVQSESIDEIRSVFGDLGA